MKDVDDCPKPLVVSSVYWTVGNFGPVIGNVINERQILFSFDSCERMKTIPVRLKPYRSYLGMTKESLLLGSGWTFDYFSSLPSSVIYTICGLVYR